MVMIITELVKVVKNKEEFKFLLLNYLKKPSRSDFKTVHSFPFI